MDKNSAHSEPPKRGIQFLASDGLPDFLRRTKTSLAFTTYQANKLFFVGVNADNRISIFERTFPRCMAIRATGNRLWMSSQYQLWQLENFLGPGELHDGCDAVFVPLIGHTTGALDIHDIIDDGNQRPVFVATRMNCLATLDDRHSFVALWTPPFIDALVAEDRCHLNGAAFEGGTARYVTCLAETNEPRGWDEKRRDGGLVLHVQSGEAVLRGLSMPHSPRLHDDRLWILQAGTGEFGVVDERAGTFDVITVLPGLTRGLAFHDGHAVIGVSGPRPERTFSGLPLHERLEAEGREPFCGIMVVDLDTGRVAHRLEIRGPISELYDVAVLPGFRRPMALGFANEEIHYYVRPADGRSFGYPPDSS